MKNRYSFYKIRFGRIEKLANRRLGKSPDEGKLKFSDVVMFLATALLFGVHYIPESVEYHREIEILIAVGVFGIGLFLTYYRMLEDMLLHDDMYEFTKDSGFKIKVEDRDF